MTLTADTTQLLAATVIVVFLSYTAVVFPAILMRNLAIILALFGIDVGND